MNTGYHTLDSPNGMANPLPRQPPTPGSGHQPNGSGGMPNLVNGLLSGGHQTDMNHLWQVVQQLSDVLAENRNQTANIMNSVQQIQARAAQEGTSPTMAQVNGDLAAATSRQQATEINNLRAQLQSAHATIASLDTQNAALRQLLQDYEAALSMVLEKLRPYAHAQHDATLALHAHYSALLERERAANLELRLEHQEWQQGLGRVAQLARHALKESAEGQLAGERRAQELRAENRLLRRLVGWEDAPSDSEDEGEEEQHLSFSHPR